MLSNDASPSTARRLLLALGLFVLALSGGGAYLLRHTGAASQHKAENTVDKGDGADEFFYSAVGATPDEETRAAAGKAAPRVANLTSFTLEFDVFHDREAAEQLIDQLRQQGVDAYYTPLSHGGRVVYRVRRGVYPNRKEADRAALALKAAGAPAAKVIKLQ